MSFSQIDASGRHATIYLCEIDGVTMRCTATQLLVRWHGGTGEIAACAFTIQCLSPSHLAFTVQSSQFVCKFPRSAPKTKILQCSAMCRMWSFFHFCAKLWQGLWPTEVAPQPFRLLLCQRILQATGSCGTVIDATTCGILRWGFVYVCKKATQLNDRWTVAVAEPCQILQQYRPNHNPTVATARDDWRPVPTKTRHCRR